MRKVVAWEHWQNPLGSPEFADVGVEAAEPDDGPDGVGVRLVVPTAGGLMPLSAYSNFSSNFNFWMMHTNFNLSRKVSHAIEKVPGVETFDLVSRYRARVGFARCFDPVQVKFAIQEALDANPAGKHQENVGGVTLDEDTRQKVAVLERHARGQCKFWAIYVLPNAEIVFANAENKTDYDDFIGLFREAQEMAGGLLLTSHE